MSAVREEHGVARGYEARATEDSGEAVRHLTEELAKTLEVVERNMAATTS